MRYTIDRIEGEWAVCEDELGQMYDVPLEAFGCEVQEGMVFDMQEDGSFTPIDPEEMEDMQEKIQRRFEALWED